MSTAHEPARNPRIERWLKQQIGMDADSIGPAAMERLLRQRMDALGCADEASYFDLLQGSQGEQQALVEAAVVPETWFFRYPESFKALVSLAQQVQPGRPLLRILSLPCSSGEEPYSIAIALLEAGLSPLEFEVDAMDISRRQLTLAAFGHYGRNAFRAAPGKGELSWRDRHFKEDGEDGWQILDPARSRVNFQPGNLLDGSLRRDGCYDFVFCRNLLIYFDRPTQLAALQVLKGLLRPGGTLFTGPAESPLLSQNGMRPLGAALTFAYQAARHPMPEDEAPIPAPEARPTVTRLATPQPQPPPPPPTPPQSQRPQAKPRPAPATAPAPAPAAAAELSLDGVIALANQGQAALACEAAQQHLQQHGPSATLYYWLGALNDVQGQTAAAQDFLRKALYLDPQHPEALAYLAALLQHRGDAAGAQRLQQRAQRAQRSTTAKNGPHA